MSHPVPAAVLRHRAPALLLDTIEAFAGDHLRCLSRHDARWRWPQVLEGAAQAAGLLAGLQPGGLANTAVIAEYRDVAIHVPVHAGRVRFDARLERRLLRFWRCHVEAQDMAGRVLLVGRVTLAPSPTPTPTPSPTPSRTPSPTPSPTR